MIVFNELVSASLNGVIASILLLMLVTKNQILEERVASKFKNASLMIFIVTILACIDLFIKSNQFTHVAAIHIITVYLRIILGPSITFVMASVYFRDHLKDIKYIAFAPIVTNFIIATAIIIASPYSFINANLMINSFQIELMGFSTAALYCIATAILAIWMVTLTPNRKEEKIYYLLFMFIITASFLIKVIFQVSFWYWTTISLCVLTYYFILTYEKLIYDQLTNAYNRVILYKDINKVKHNQKFVISVIDINNLKYINDTFGHKSGDSAISGITTSIFNNISKHDSLYRYGGDEFILISKGNNIDRIEKSLSKALIDCGFVNGVKLSFAFASVLHFEGSIEDSMKIADEKMYQHKKAMKAGR